MLSCCVPPALDAGTICADLSDRAMIGLYPHILICLLNLVIGFGAGWLFKIARDVQRGRAKADDNNLATLLRIVNDVETSASNQIQSWETLRHFLVFPTADVSLRPHIHSNRCYEQLLQAYEDSLRQLDPQHEVVPREFTNELSQNRKAVHEFAVGLEESEAGELKPGHLLQHLKELEDLNESLCEELASARQTIAEQSYELEYARVAAFEDYLTKLPNRRAFEQRLAEAGDLMQHGGPGFCMMMIDLDRFKQINDNYGHSAGDASLQVAAKVISECCRGTDYVARYGGEEFSVLCIDCNLDGAKLLAERIRKRIEATVINFEGVAIEFSCSIGVAQAEQGCLGQNLVDVVDTLLYAAKDCGRNLVRGLPSRRNVDEAAAASLQVVHTA